MRRASAYPALRKFVDKGRRAGGGLKNDDLLMAFKSAEQSFYRRQEATPQISPCGTFGLHLLGDKRWIHL